MRFSRENLIDAISRYYKSYQRYGHCPNQLNKCKAWYSDMYYDDILDADIMILQSYNTPVAVYVYDTNTVYRFGSWSATTAQHEFKFYRDIVKAQEMVDYGSTGLFRGWR